MLTILIIDDDPDLSDALGEMIAALGHRVALARTGAEGVARLASARFDVILLDFRLPDGTGASWLPDIRERAPDARVYIITGFLEDGVEAGCRALGVADFLIKPFSVRDLVARLVAELSPG